jgi:acetyl esterase
VALGGASAGACLTAAAALGLAFRGETQPSELVLAYGTFHRELPALSPDIRQRLRGRHGFTRFRPATVRRMNRNYAGSPQAEAEPLAFPGGHPPVGMPPTLLIDADRDSLRASGAAFAAELSAAQVPVEYHVVTESAHGFFDRPGAEYFARGISIIASRLLKPKGRTTHGS